MFKKIKQFTHFLFAYLAYWYYGRPAKKLIVVGVTGTKGKSTTARLIASVLEAGGHKVGLLTTVEFQIAEKRWPNVKKMTMLGKGQIQQMLRDMVRAGCTYAVVETSSEGILQYRHIGLCYDVAVFTNLGTEHSERHGGFENLKRDKGKLFAALSANPHKTIHGKKTPKTIVVNTDDQNAEYFLHFKADEKYGYGTKISNIQYPISNIVGKVISSDEQGSLFEANNFKYKLNIVGDFNIPNALAAIAVGKSQGISDEKIAEGLASVKLVEGRMEFINVGQPFKVVVDYAHEPMSLTALFTTLRQLVGTGGKVIAVVGSDGGGRDKQKRAKMGNIAGKIADTVVITDVNCFDEDPRAIAEMLAVGAREAGKKDGIDLFIEVDRRAGIQKALELARPGDTVAITAKGTEPVICVANGVKIPWDDRKVARELLQKIGY
ncbi:MAG: hypothetical protein A2754_02680 [Candidatus Magasanikbacteria bacterium RIFCSPHIGHO2_01_FULL_47_8]|uniref:UDP-N-acetylmuramoyl-L-alanyl-D-glutamate--2, 6-diaminopimelate ligase n=1 Tax=Candidatus Magasanikbacteria bacterium RIFCSPHIGHO2_01_FULL_47_8 TaxID=1798673 RepID=A0A1F6MCQ8_9BACT|nr:MAG: hypothetical protein A2754_02680 [Candidatus Magasanikbacteria bacterium RIFCSPHIGHO2_01_FULL_47_8]